VRPESIVCRSKTEGAEDGEDDLLLSAR